MAIINDPHYSHSIIFDMPTHRFAVYKLANVYVIVDGADTAVCHTFNCTMQSIDAIIRRSGSNLSMNYLHGLSHLLSGEECHHIYRCDSDGVWLRDLRRL